MIRRDCAHKMYFTYGWLLNRTYQYSIWYSTEDTVMQKTKNKIDRKAKFLNDAHSIQTYFVRQEPGEDYSIMWVDSRNS